MRCSFPMTVTAALGEKFAAIWPHLDERAKRLLAATEAQQLGYGGVTAASKACGLSRVTITKARDWLDAAPLETGRIRKQGGDRRSLATKIQASRNPSRRSWNRFPVAIQSLRCNGPARASGTSHRMKTEAGIYHTGRDEQFQRINAKVQAALPPPQIALRHPNRSMNLRGVLNQSFR